MKCDKHSNQRIIVCVVVRSVLVLVGQEGATLTAGVKRRHSSLTISCVLNDFSLTRSSISNNDKNIHEMSAPQYLGPASAQSAPSLTTILKDQITNPAYREGNLKYVRILEEIAEVRRTHVPHSILKAVSIFVIGVAFARSGLSSALVPVF